LHSVRHQSGQSPTQRQQHNRKHNRDAEQTSKEGEKETLRSFVAELKGRRDDTSLDFHGTQFT